MTFFWLIFAHSIGDLGLQHEGIGGRKHSFPMILLGHSIIWGGCIGLALELLGLNFAPWKAMFLILGHLVSDYLSSNHAVKYPQDVQIANLFDQIFHLFQLIIVYIL